MSKCTKQSLKHQMSWAQILHTEYVPLQAKFLQKRVHTGGLASIGVFTCFYGGSKERESTDADFYVGIG